MEDLALNIVHAYHPMMVVVFGFCAMALYYGGWPILQEERKKPTHIRMISFAAQLMSMLYFLLFQVGHCCTTLSSHPMWDIMLEWLGTVVLLAIPVQAVYLRQQHMTRYNWAVVTVPAVVSLLVVLIAGPSDIAEYTISALYVYELGAYGVALWRLRRWDRRMMDEFSDISHKQTLWFRHLSLPIMLLVLLWIPATMLPQGIWIWVVYYPALTIVLIHTTSHLLTQEEFCFEHEEEQPALAEEPATAAAANANAAAAAAGATAAAGARDLPHWAERLDRLMEEQRYYLNPDLTLTMLAREIGANRTYLSNYLNQTKGMTFYAYVNSFRLREAERLLLTTDLPIRNITTLCGFAQYVTFIRLFKSTHNATPSEWRILNKS